MSITLRSLEKFKQQSKLIRGLDLPGPTHAAAPPPHSPSPSPTPRTTTTVPNHLRSLSVDADFFEGLQFDVGSSGGERKGSGGYRRTSSVDSVGAYFDDGEGSLVDGGVKKAMPPEKLAELALIDPKCAKRLPY